MEDLMDAGITPSDMVRLGARSKCTEATLPLLLRQSSNGRGRRASSWATINRVKEEAKEASKDIHQAWNEFTTIYDSWKKVSSFLEFSCEDGDFYDALVVAEILGHGRVSVPRESKLAQITFSDAGSRVKMRESSGPPL
jgi:antitoxin component of RelBE/YafQ-DinJ toxin-antitoxin module